LGKARLEPARELAVTAPIHEHELASRVTGGTRRRTLGMGERDLLVLAACHQHHGDRQRAAARSGEIAVNVVAENRKDQPRRSPTNGYFKYQSQPYSSYPRVRRSANGA